MSEPGGGLKLAGESLAVEDVVAEDEGAGVSGDEVAADEEGLGKAVGAGLDGVLDLDAPLAAVAEQIGEAGGVLRAWR